jgi:hypothetical protein
LTAGQTTGYRLKYKHENFHRKSPNGSANFVETTLANGEYPDAEHLLLGALYQLKEQHMNEGGELEITEAWG